MIRLLIADDHTLVRKGIRALLEKSGEVQVLAEAENGYDAVELTIEKKPDVVVMDLSMPRLDGVQAAEQILALNQATEIIILSMHSDTAMIKQLLSRGVKGYLLKDSLTDELMLAVNSVSQGKLYLSPSISEPVMTMLLSPNDYSASKMGDLLTSREREVLQLIAEGNTNKGIADILIISVKTVEKHRANLMAKMEVNDLASLIREGIKQGLIFIDK